MATTCSSNRRDLAFLQGPGFHQVEADGTAKRKKEKILNPAKALKPNEGAQLSKNKNCLTHMI